VIELRAGKVLRDERAGSYALETTREMDAMLLDGLRTPQARRLRREEDDEA